MAIAQAKLLVHAISNKLTATLGFLELASDNNEKKDEYLGKARREVWDAVKLVPHLALVLTEISSADAVALAEQARQDAEAATVLLEDARKAADALTEKARKVAEQLRAAQLDLKVVPMAKPAPKE